MPPSIKGYHQLAVLISLMLLVTLSQTGTHSGRGRDFYVAFPCHSPGANDNKYLTLYVIIFNPTVSSVDVQIRFPKMTSLSPKSFTLAAGEGSRIDLDKSLELIGSMTHKKGIQIHASDQVEVQVNSAVAGNVNQSSGSYMALPSESLSTEYVIATHCDYNHCFCSIVMTENSTVVNVHLRKVGVGNVNYDGIDYADMDIIVVWGDIGDVMQVSCSSCDLSGTMVKASRNVSVIAGGQFTRIDSNSKDQVIEQLLPWEIAGDYYIIGRDIAYSASTEVIKVVTYDVCTQFCYNTECTTSTEVQQTFQFRRALNTLVNITATARIVVARFMEPQRTGDAVMYLALPLSQWVTDEYEIFVYGTAWTVIHLVLITDVLNKPHLQVVTLDKNGNVPQAINFGTETPLRDGEFLEMSVQLPPGRNYALRVRCQKLGGSCGPFSGYVYSASNYKASTVPLMPQLTWDPEQNGQLPVKSCSETSTTPVHTTMPDTTAIHTTVPDETAVHTTVPDTTAVHTTVPDTTPAAATAITDTATFESATAQLTIVTRSPDPMTLAPSTLRSNNTGKSSSTFKMCPCRCAGKTVSRTQSSNQLSEAQMVDQIQKDLTLETDSLSQKRRLKTSVEDNRPISVSLGASAVAILMTLCLLFLCFDFLNFCKGRKCRCCCTRTKPAAKRQHKKSA